MLNLFLWESRAQSSSPGEEHLSALHHSLPHASSEGSNVQPGRDRVHCTNEHAPDKLLLFPSSPLQASFPLHCNAGKLSKPPVSPIFSRSQQEWGSAPQPSAACAVPRQASDTSRSLGRSAWPAGPATRACRQEKQVYSCCYGDKLGPKAGLNALFIVFARGTGQLKEEKFFTASIM